jgi:hypothetical protein
MLERRIADDVIASHRILQQAVVAQDLELFTSFLSKENAAWLQTQRQLLAEGLITGRDALGLALQPAANTATVDLAELHFEQQYLVTGLVGSEQSIRLQQTSLYRYFRTQRWLQVPPDEDFWGKTLTDDTDVLTLEYPERDASLAQRLGDDLQVALQAMCDGQAANAADPCSSLHVNLRLTTDPAVLVSLAKQPSPVFQGRTFLMPAPTLVGIPLDEESYRAIYNGYTKRILETVGNNLQAPLPMPEQVVQMLCRDGRERGLHAYQYDPWFDTWSAVASAEMYGSLQPMPADSGVVLRHGLPGTDLYDVQLTLLRDGREYSLVEVAGSAEELVTLVGFAPGAESNLLIRNNDRSVANVDYQVLDVDSCADGRCILQLMRGFPVWSPDGRYVLLADGGKIYRQDWREQPVEVGNGFNAFWLTADTYGYINFAREDTGPAMQIVVASIRDDQPHVILTTNDLATALDARPLAITYVVPNPADPNGLYLAVTSTGVDQDFFLVSASLPTGDVFASGGNNGLTVHLQLEELPRGDAMLLTPTGFPPFVFSPNGRFVLLVERTERDDPQVDNIAAADPASGEFWKLLLDDTHQRKTQTVTLTHPAYPSRFPFYDWSADGQWLAAVDDGLIRLIAPQFGYERLVPHDLNACYYAGWTDVVAER